MGRLLQLGDRSLSEEQRNFNVAIKAACVSKTTPMLRDVRRAGGEVVHGRWRLHEFEVTEEASMLEAVKAQMRGHPDRWVPPGKYVGLQRRPTPSENAEWYGMLDWVTVMSDTPDEINDHAEMLLWAEGRVLIHGLGLGCVIHGLLSRDNVTSIDVVEVDPDVIALTAPYLTDPRVTIHEGDCSTFEWPRGSHWEYVWHDIWSNISSSNLSDDERAEHGISYATLHRKFGHRCDYQFSWAFRRAQKMRGIERREEKREEQFARAWKDAPNAEARVMLLAERQRRELGVPRKGAEAHFWMLWSSGTLDQWRKAAVDFSEEDYQRWLEKANLADARGHRPNDLIQRSGTDG